MESKVLRCFLPDLVAAISDCVHSVSDRCLADGLIPDSTYRRILESGGTSEDKTRNLLLAVIKSTETDSRCLGILLNILEQVLPHGARHALILTIKKKLIEHGTCTSVVAMGQNSQASLGTPLTSGEVMKYQTSLFGKLEDSIRQHEHACAEKELLEESLKSKEEENERLKYELEHLKLIHQKTDNAESNNEILASMENRISAFEAEMSELRGRIEELESIIEEQGMQVKRGRNAVGLDIAHLMSQLNFLAEKGIAEMKLDNERKETEFLAALREKEEKLRKKEVQHKKKERIMQAELMAALAESREKERCCLKALKENDVKLQLERREKERVQEELKVLQHKVALIEKDLKIKDLELSHELQKKKPQLEEVRNTGERSKLGFFDRFRNKMRQLDTKESTSESAYRCPGLTVPTPSALPDSTEKQPYALRRAYKLRSNTTKEQPYGILSYTN